VVPLSLISVQFMPFSFNMVGPVDSWEWGGPTTMPTSRLALSDSDPNFKDRQAAS